MYLQRSLLLLCLWAVLIVSSVQAQGLGRVQQTESNIGSYYFYTQPGMATVQVQVLGAVRSPGLYEVADGTKLRQLLALSGGPLVGNREGSRRQETVIRLMRPGGPGGESLYRASLDDALMERNASPVLTDGDVLMVEVVEHRRFSWRDAVTIIGGAASLALAVERFSGMR